MALVLALPVSATIHPKAHKLCTTLSTSAGYTLKDRYNGALVSDEMKAISEGGYSGEFKDYLFAVTASAYEEPQYSSEEYKEKHIVEFENAHYMRCINSLNENQNPYGLE